MPRGKKELAEQIIPKLREVEVEVGRGKTVLEAVKKIGVTEQTYYRWKKKFGGLRIDQAKRLKDLEKENAGGASPADAAAEERFQGRSAPRGKIQP
jgi:putative transposase